MKHYILQTLLSMAFLALPMYAHATSEPSENMIETSSVNDDAANFSLSITKNAVQVHAVNCQGQVLRVYDMVGKLKYEAVIDSNDKTIRLSLSKGVYLINLNQVTRRVSIVG